MGWLKGFWPATAMCIFASVASAVTPQEEAVEALEALHWNGPRVVLQVRSARTFPIPKRFEQEGPTCGFFRATFISRSRRSNTSDWAIR